MPLTLAAAALLYGANLVVGLLAQTGRFRFGRAHHWLYFVVFSAAALAALRHFHPALLLTLAALALLPRSRPGGWRHPLLAVVGACGFLLTVTI